MSTVPIFLGDGIKTARPEQRDFLSHLRKTWDTHKAHAAHLPPGYGKTFISKTIQKEFGSSAMIVTISNHLLDQYCEEYRDLVPLKGRQHYASIDDYFEAFRQAKSSSCIANPLSYYYGVRSGRLQVPKILIVDEAHKLYDTLMLAAHMDFNVVDLSIPQFNSDFELVSWAKNMLKICESRLSRIGELSSSQQDEFFKVLEQLTLLTDMVSPGSHTFTFYYQFIRTKGVTQKVLRILPIHLPTKILEPFLAPRRLVMLSGTLTKYDLKHFPIDFSFYGGDYLTKFENRVINYYPLPAPHRKNPEAIANRILTIYEQEGKPNTVVHVTYDLANKLAPLLPEAITHTKSNKLNAIYRFKTEGGLLLASGCAEGIDLPDNECRLIIIPVLMYPDLGNELVRKRLALENNSIRYNLDTLITTVQQLGRGTRHHNDYCKSYILDPLFSTLYSQMHNYLPNSLNINWVGM